MKPLVITGPTAGGKSKLSLELSEHISMEIISMDSMAIFKEAPIVTDQLSQEAREKCPHHLIDFLEVEEEYSTADWKRQAEQHINTIQSKNKLPVFVGGTFLYLSSLLQGIHSLPPADNTIRAHHQDIFDNEGPAVLWEKLNYIDAETATQLHPNDLKRVSRALEIYELSGKTRSDIFSSSEPNKIDCDVVFLDWDRGEIYKRCDERVDVMVKSGLIEEIDQLRHRALSQSFKQAVGVREVISYLKGDMSKETMLDEMKKKTRHLAKHQFTWAKRLNVTYLGGDSPSLLGEIRKIALN